MVFSTVVGSDGTTSLVGTAGSDNTTISTLFCDVLISGSAGDDSVTLEVSFIVRDYAVRMGGGDDEFISFDPILDSFISLDGEVRANDGDDKFESDKLIINSEVVGRGGNDTFKGRLGFGGVRLYNSEINGNTGDDNIVIGESSAADVFGGADRDTIRVIGDADEVEVNGNKGSDFIEVAVVNYADSAIYGGQCSDLILVSSKLYH